MKMKTATMRFPGMILIATVLLSGLATTQLVRDLYAAPQTEAKSQPQVLSVVNVNKASLDELVSIRGIGPVLAKRILDYRTANGPFSKIDDLANVRGVGGAKFEKIKGQISV